MRLYYQAAISFGKSDLFFMDWLSLIEWLAPKWINY